MKREEIFRAYFSNPIKLKTRELTNTNTLYITNLGIFPTNQLSTLNLDKPGFKLTFLTDTYASIFDEVKRGYEEFLDEQIESLEKLGLADGWELAECVIEDNAGYVDGSQFVHLTWIREGFKTKDSENHYATIPIYETNFRALLEQGRNHAFIIEYHEEEDSYYTMSRYFITEIINGQKTQTIEHWGLPHMEGEKKRFLPWKITYYKTT